MPVAIVRVKQRPTRIYHRDDSVEETTVEWYVSVGTWHGQQVELFSDEPIPCPLDEHRLELLEFDGCIDYILLCSSCDAMAGEPAPQTVCPRCGACIGEPACLAWWETHPTEPHSADEMVR